MANYNINIESSEGYREADPAEVTFTAGDTVTFITDSSAANLCFTSATAAILSPTPSLCVAIAPGTSQSYTFTSDSAGVYFSQVMPDDVACPSAISGSESGSGAVLIVLPGEDPIYDGTLDSPPGN